MILNYAVSVSNPQFCDPAWASAFARSGFKAIEASFGVLPSTGETDVAVRVLGSLVEAGTVEVASVHLPFSPFDQWGYASLDEEVRNQTVVRVLDFMARVERLGVREMTIHSGGEPNLPEERQSKIDAMRRTLEALLPRLEAMDASINVEWLPRSCIGHSEAELWSVVEGFSSRHVNFCFDVNHVMSRTTEIAAIAASLLPRLHVLHLSDYDGVDECHWYPGMGVIDWPPVMKAVRSADHDILGIFEVDALRPPAWQNREVNPMIHLRNLARSREFLL